ncbi:MAG: hypothetical protein HY718_16955, partial [Planctomycetes bacterium]|nr:hypothetical protein [Planctomycetota bacterium]
MMPVRPSRCSACLLVPLAFALPGPVAAPPGPTTQPLPDVVDDVVLFETLRRHGLDDWLQQYLADVPPADKIGVALAERQRLLTRAAAPGRSAEQARADVVEAGRLLTDLIAGHPDDPRSLRWQLELARDYLERQCPSAFENLLMYELPGRDTAIARDLASRTIETLRELRRRIADTWKSVEDLDEFTLTAVRGSGSLSMLESLDATSAMLMTWAKLYRAASAGADTDDGQRVAAFAEVLADVTKSGWLDLPPGREPEQAGASLIAAVAERQTGQYDQAEGRARQVIALLGRITDRAVRQRLRQLALLAVLEQIRAGRDAGRYDAALQGIEPARQWFLKNRPDEPAPLVAMALLEASILSRRQQSVSQRSVPSRRPAAWPAAWLRSSECLDAMQRLCSLSSAHRDLLYAVLAASLGSVPFADDVPPFGLQLLVGAAVADADFNSTADASIAAGRLRDTITAARRPIAAATTQGHAPLAGEMRYLLGRALAEQDNRLDAVQVLADLVEQFPAHDRGDAAARRAVGLATEELRRSGPGGSPASRAAFVRAARILRQRLPADPSAAELTYAVAVALENDARYEDAAAEYASVPAGHPRSPDAALGRLRSWRQALDQASADRPLDATGLAGLADQAKAAIREVQRTAVTRPAPGEAGTTGRGPDCGEGSLILAIAELLNHPAVGGADEAARLMRDFDARFATCHDLLGPALRQRILALRQLRKLQEARGMVDRYLAADPENAGTVMAGLLQAMHDETQAALRRGDAAAGTVAAEAVQLGQSLIDWAAARPGGMTPLN